LTEEKKKEVEKEILIDVLDKQLKKGKINEWIKTQNPGKELQKKDRDKITNHFEKYFDQDLHGKTDKSEWNQIIEDFAEKYQEEFKK